MPRIMDGDVSGNGGDADAQNPDRLVTAARVAGAITAVAWAIAAVAGAVAALAHLF